MHQRLNKALDVLKTSFKSDAYMSRKSMSKIYAAADDDADPLLTALSSAQDGGKPLKRSSSSGSFYYAPVSSAPKSVRSVGGSSDRLSGARSEAHKVDNASHHGEPVHGGSQHGLGASRHGSPGKPEHDLSKPVLSHDEQVSALIPSVARALVHVFFVQCMIVVC